MANKRTTKKNRFATKFKLTAKFKFLVFISVFGILGGIVYLYVSHANPYMSGPSSSCTMSGLSKSVVRPGETVTAKITITNTSTNNSTFSSQYFGAHILELNYGFDNGFTSFWTPNRFYPYMNIAPNQSATFTITAKAPSTPGQYPFGWAVGIGGLGAVAFGCSGTNIRVVNPPTVTLRANNQADTITVTKGSVLTLSWATKDTDSCSASAGWSGAKNKAGGSENRIVDTSTTGRRSYTMTCKNLVAEAKSSVTVNVTEPPVVPQPKPNPNPTPSPKPSTPTNPAPPRTTTRTANPAPAAPATPDTTPPTAPSVFSAAYEESAIELSWSEATDDTGIKNYVLERSRDNTNWEVLTGDGTAEISYSDTSVAFNVIYQYRLQAFDFAGNKSAYATTSAQAGTFEPNATSEQEFSATSEDGLITVTVPTGALTQDAMCDLRSSEFIPPTVDGYEALSSTYELLCKTLDGSKVTSFTQPVRVKLNTAHELAKKYKQLQVHGLQQDNWQLLDAGDEADTFVLGDANNIAVLGQVKKTPLWHTLLKILLVLLLLIGGGILGLRRFYKYKYRNSVQSKARDFYNKEHGY